MDGGVLDANLRFEVLTSMSRHLINDGVGSGILE